MGAVSPLVILIYNIPEAAPPPAPAKMARSSSITFQMIFFVLSDITLKISDKVKWKTVKVSTPRGADYERLTSGVEVIIVSYSQLEAIAG